MSSRRRERSIIPSAIAAAVACTVALVACGQHAAGAATSALTGPSTARAIKHVPDGDWTQFDFNAARTGVGPAATGITPGRLSLLRLRQVHINGTVDASAIALHGVKVRGRRRDIVVMTTTYGRTLALDPGTGARLWEFTPGDIGSYAGSAQVTTATPIADPNRRYVYAATPNGRIHKLSVATGREIRSGHWPVRVTFDATREKIASPLNISGRSLIVVTGGYIGDAPPYQGHVVVIGLSGGAILHVFNTLCSDRHSLINPPGGCPASDSAIWGRAGAVVEPGTHRILVATGNAPFNGSTNWGDSTLELSPDASRLLHNWTPTNQAQLSSSDTDLGSTSPAVLPPYNGYRLAVQGSKDGHLHLLDLNRLNGTTGGASPRLGGELQNIATPGGGEVLTAPAVWGHGGRIYVFVADDSGTAAYVLTGSRPSLQFVWQSSTPGTSPVLAGGLLYVYDELHGVLKVYFPVSGHILASLPAASGHWNSPIVVGGRIILPVGTYHDQSSSGVVLIYHLPGR
ncbi:MAG: PQQ-binding-like beta-propeller repeat protein [Solirubrobacteraceae bacterium]